MATAATLLTNRATANGSHDGLHHHSAHIVPDGDYAPVKEIVASPLEQRLHAIKKDFFSDPRTLCSAYWPRGLRAFLLQIANLLPEAEALDLNPLVDQLRTPGTNHIAPVYRRQCKLIVDDLISGQLKLAAPFKASSRHGSQDGLASWPTDIVAPADLREGVIGMTLRSDAAMYLHRFFDSRGVPHRIAFNLRAECDAADSFRPITVAVDAAKADVHALYAALESEGRRLASSVNPPCMNEQPSALVQLDPVDAAALDVYAGGSPLKESRGAE